MKETNTTIRARFAPSPTGPLHMGSVRTALFNYLLAKKLGGVFILRIEDTDKERSKPEWEKDLLDNLAWLNLNHDEGPIAGGTYGPYRQSERTEIYKKYLVRLLEQGKAYHCFCAVEDLEAQRQSQLANGQAPKYLGTCRGLPKEQAQKNLAEGKPSIIRFIVENKKLSFHDLIRGKIEFDTALFGDMVIAKDIKTPLYNFSVVVDDYEMQITHVIRGEDHIPNTPKQMLLQEVFGFPAPQFAHLPLILGPDKTKLSKRHGDNSVTKYKKEGYLPEAVINFLALLGWNPGGERELYTLEELVQEFSMERVQKGGAIFNITRLEFLNGHYIRQKSLSQLTELCLPYLIESNLLEQKGSDIYAKATQEKIDHETLEKIIGLYRERLKVLCDITQYVDFFFVENIVYDKELLQWKDSSDEKLRNVLERAGELLSKIPETEWEQEKLSSTLMAEADKETNRGYFLWPLRAALTGKKASAGPFEIAEILGKNKTLKRIEAAKAKL
ncbi:MAG: glutamate--tRNA ligase [Candidatus Wildermuthbacteria bacterium]|nr:glutamate--tRNA ligase [Candidatus Wildermuthbacteria bacterium]